MIGLVDGDLIVYNCGFSVEKNVKVPLENGDIEHKKEVAPLSHALQNTDTLMQSLAAKFDKLEVYITGSGNWRKEFAKIEPYKGNRSPFGKPVYYKEVRQYLVDKYKATVVEGMEADDALGIRQTKDNDSTCIVSYDKDLLMIPGSHYNWKKDESKYIAERTGLRSFYAQVLSGDATDNIPGIYGIGKGRAEKLLAKFSDERAYWQVAKREWSNHYPRGYNSRDGLRVFPADQAVVEVASLLWIARSGREKWSPPQ